MEAGNRKPTPVRSEVGSIVAQCGLTQADSTSSRTNAHHHQEEAFRCATGETASVIMAFHKYAGVDGSSSRGMTPAILCTLGRPGPIPLRVAAGFPSPGYDRPVRDGEGTMSRFTISVRACASE